ncbi:MAG: RNA methyltransferase [Anaerolineae bacterium]
MSDPIPIDDVDDPRIEDYRHVRDRDLLGRAGRPGLFIGEQRLIVQRMLARPGRTKSVLVLPSRLPSVGPLVPPDVPLYVAGENVMRAIVGFDVHRGVLAVGFREPDAAHTLLAALPAPSGDPLTVLVLEDITHHDNLGMLFRDAAAFGVDAVVLSPRCHDPLYRRCLRMSIGHVLDVPWARAADWPADLTALRARWGCTLIAAATGPGSVPLDDAPRSERIALLVGTEHDGLSAAALAACDARVRVPMRAGVDSLNVAVAAAVCLHRLSRGERA